MSTLEQRIIGLAQTIGVDVKNINSTIGVLTNLSTTQKSNLVAAINELKSDIASIDLTELIDDAATAGDTNSTYSVDKILSLLSALKSDVLGGLPPSTLDTIKELADFLNDNTVSGGLIEQLGNRVRIDSAQSFTGPQQAQGRANIGAAASSDLTALSDAIGNTDHNFVADYNTSKA